MDAEFYEQLQKRRKESPQTPDQSLGELSEPDCPTVSTPEPKPKSEATSESDVTKIQKQPQPSQPPSPLPQRRISRSTHRHNHNNRTPQDDVNWVEIASEVAKRLKGEPDSVISKGKILCWGRKQSFKVNTEQGSFSDFEADVHGGVIKMVEHVLGCSRSQALTWLSDHGLISKRNGTRYQSHTPSRQKQSPKTPAAPQKTKPKSKGKLDYGLKLWNASEPISLDSTHPARRWLNNRNLIPIDKQAPEAIRWHKGTHCIVACIATLKEWEEAYPSLPTPSAIHVIAIDQNGKKRMAFGGPGDKRTYGQVDGTGILLLGDPNDETINICEGLADALAISTREAGAVIATITTLRKLKNDHPTSSKLAKRDVCIFSDSDKAGIEAGDDLIKSLLYAGAKRVRKRNDTNAKDPAERAAAE